MKFLAIVFLFAAVAMIAADAYVPPVQKPHPNKPKFPTFPGQGPFNPGRFPRSADKGNKGQISISGQKGGGQSQWNVEAQHKVWENKHGSIHINGGVNKPPGGKPQGQIGIGGSFQWG